jgi:hypothetical protein
MRKKASIHGLCMGNKYFILFKVLSISIVLKLRQVGEVSEQLPRIYLLEELL